VSCEVFCCLSGLSDELKEMKAEREKNKGNEAFRASDFEEALVYYSRSLSLLKTVAAHNNRAQTCMLHSFRCNVGTGNCIAFKRCDCFLCSFWGKD